MTLSAFLFMDYVVFFLFIYLHLTLSVFFFCLAVLINTFRFMCMAADCQLSFKVTF